MLNNWWPKGYLAWLAALAPVGSVARTLSGQGSVSNTLLIAIVFYACVMVGTRAYHAVAGRIKRS